jgi:hypothetical protein
VAYLDAQVAFIAGLVAETLQALGPRAAKSHTYDTGKTITLTPLVDRAAFKITTGAARALAIHERFALITVIPGVTTYAQVAADWAASGQAVALASIAGTAGTFPAGYTGTGGSIALYNDAVPPHVRGVYKYPMPANPPDTRFPALVVFRRAEPQIEGSARNKRTVDLEIGYFLGKKTGAELEDGWGCLSTRVGQICEAFIARWHPGFESGVQLETLCDVAEVHVESVVYGAQLPDGTMDREYPCVTLTVRLVHADAHVTDTAALTRVVCKYGLNQQPDASNEMVRRYADTT